MIMLKRYLYNLTEKEEGWAKWLDFRMRLLTRWEEQRGELICYYCNKGPLLKEEDNSHPMVATLDHVIPRSKGGGEYDEDNLVVACYSCNNKKADKIL